MVDISIIESADNLLGLEKEWGILHSEANGTIFQTFNWNYNWWKIYFKSNYLLQVVTFRNDNKLIGILPLFNESVNLGLFKFSRLRFIGVYESYGEYEPLVHPNYRSDVSSAIIAFFNDELQNKKCDMISLFRFSPSSELMNDIRNRIDIRKFNVQFQPNCVIRIVMPLEKNWDSYLNRLSPTEKHMLLRRTRSLFKNGVELEILENNSVTEDAFDDFVRLHTIAWTDKGRTGYYSSDRFKNFHRSVTLSERNNRRARLYFLKKNNVRFAAVQAFFINDTCCFYLSGMDKNFELSHQSPGKVLLSMVIKDAIMEGFKYFDFQGGNEDYKYRLGGIKTAFSKLHFWNKGSATMKVFLFLGLQNSRRFLLDTVWDNTVIRLARLIKTKFTNSNFSVL